LKEEFEKFAYINKWDEETCFKFCRKLPQHKDKSELWDAICSSSSVKEFMQKLKITDSDLNDVRGEREKRIRERNYEKKKVEVYGEDFYNIEENFSSLWNHITSEVGDDEVSDVDFRNTENLADQQIRKKKKPRGNRRKPRSTSRRRSGNESLIGLAGEIHVYRTLRKTYGNHVVGPVCWKSEYSKYKYPENSTDDGYGCDFEVRQDKKVYYIEVKATITDDESFDLGPSQIELAIDCAATPRKREFLIFHVLNALDRQPSIRILPNPYHKKFKSKYYIEEAGLKVRYRRE